MRIVSHLISGWREKLTLAGKAMREAGEPEAAARDPSLFALVFDVEPRLLLEARRKLRRGDRSGALETTNDMLEACGAFLRGLEDRTGAGS